MTPAEQTALRETAETTPTLGPAGVLPPGNWLRRADVVHAGSFIIPDGEPGVVVAGAGASCPWVYWVAKAKAVSAARERLRLDLSGDLSHGTRALLALCAPEVPQPRCPPWWRYNRARRQYELGVEDRVLLTFGIVGTTYTMPVPGVGEPVHIDKALALALEQLAKGGT